MKRIFILALLSLAATTVFAQTAEPSKPTIDPVKKDTLWRYKGLTGLNFSQAQLVNWSAGGDNTVSGNVYLNGSLNYKKGHWEWNNVLNTQFGMMYTTTNGWQKTVDNLQFTSKIGYTHNEKLYYSFLADFTTQYAKGYKSPTDDFYISNFMAPGYLNLALGIDYKPSKILSLFYSPITEHFTFVLDDSLSRAGAFGVDPGDKVRAQTGMYAKVGLTMSLASNIQLVTTADFFTAYDDTFGNIVVNWDLLLSMKINKWLTASIATSLKYDDSIKTVGDNGLPEGPKVQFKEILGIGVSYSF